MELPPSRGVSLITMTQWQTPARLCWQKRSSNRSSEVPAMKPMDRRDFMKVAGATTLLGQVPSLAVALAAGDPATAPAASNSATKADYTLRIASARIELGPGHTVSTTAYNGQFPGPLLRFTEGRRVTVDIHNDTDTPEQLHWHGQNVPVDVDGAAEEGTPFIPAHGMRRVSFVPGPAGLRFYHSHL